VLFNELLPFGHVAAKTSRDSVVRTTVAKALDWIASAREAPRPERAAAATIEFAL
jgi:hypothetical protein